LSRSPVDFADARRVVIFVLGVAVIIDALTEPTRVVAQLIIGTILLGVVPIDELVGRWPRPLPPVPPRPTPDPGTTWVGPR
jgi:hypothetical protein